MVSETIFVNNIENLIAIRFLSSGTAGKLKICIEALSKDGMTKAVINCPKMLPVKETSNESMRNM